MAEKVYTALYNMGETARIEGFEIPISLPDRPAARFMRNYGLPQDEQKYKKMDFSGWEKLLPHEKDELVASEIHKRKNGEWWLIKGQEVYVNGWAHFYFNYWWCEFGSLPDFRIEAVEFFQVWDHCFRDENCFGLFDIKGRRCGDTEKALCIGFDLCTRYRNSWFGQQNINEKEAEANFDRVVAAYQRMQPWFRPLSTSGEAPKSELVLEVPVDGRAAAARDRSKGISKLRGLSSRIDFRPTTLAQYDGKRLRYYYNDEPGKLDTKKMDLNKQWAIVQHCLALFNKKKIVGKAVFTTTVEQIKGGENIETVRNFWYGSDPAQRLSSGRTESGLYRYFRSFELGYDIDEWGFPKREEARRYRDEELRMMMAKGDMEGAAAFRRKLPATVDEALDTPATDCPLFPDMLDLQRSNLQRILARGTGEERMRMEVRGDLVWSNGRGSSVKWMPNASSGKWYISQHPVKGNASVNMDGNRFPGNRGIYTIGVDPVDHVKPKEARHSKPAIAVFAPFNPLLETGDIYNGDGEIDSAKVEFMRTDQFVCVYKYRPNDPFEFYEDVMKTMIYYSAPALIERDKPGVIGFLKQQGMAAFLAHKPYDIGVGVRREAEPGAKGSAPLQQVYIPMIQTHIMTRISTYRHIIQLEDFRQFTGDNMGKCDLLVASGFALMLAGTAVRIRNNQKQWAETPW